MVGCGVGICDVDVLFCGRKGFGIVMPCCCVKSAGMGMACCSVGCAGVESVCCGVRMFANSGEGASVDGMSCCCVDAVGIGVM